MSPVSGTEKKIIVSDMEHLRKLFIMPDSPDKFIEFGRELLSLIHSFFKEKGGIHSEISLGELYSLFSDTSIPDGPSLLKDVLEEVRTRLVAHSVKVGSPYYIGHMTSAIPYFMILLEMIIASLNQNQVKIETAKASTFVEREFITWMHRLVYGRDDSFYRENLLNRDFRAGTVVLDGTLGNLTALLVARNSLFPSDGEFKGIRHSGVATAYKHAGIDRAVIIVSQRGHYSIDKVARIIGIGDENVIKIPVDENDRIDIAALRSVLDGIRESNADGSERTAIVALVGIAGTTETGSIDPLDEMADIAREYGIFFHVDAAWGGAVLIVDEQREKFKGIERADSVCLDAHKLLYSPVSMGVTVFKSLEALGHIKHFSNYIIRPDSVDLGRFSVEGSRPFSALKPWATLKVIGRAGFKLLFDYAFGLTGELSRIIDAHSNFERTNRPDLFITNYRFVPENVMALLREKMKSAKQDGVDKEKSLTDIAAINELLNELNIELHKALREEDASFVSRTMLEIPYYFRQNIVILRAITVNPLTTKAILSEILNQQNRLGLAIYESEFSRRFECFHV